MKLWNHTGRPWMRNLKAVGYAINGLGCGAVPLTRGNASGSFLAMLSFARGAKVEDLHPIPHTPGLGWTPSYQKLRGRLDAYGLSGSQLFQIHSRVMFLRYLGRGGYGNPTLTGNTSDHGFGYTNFSIENVRHGDFTLSGEDHRVLEGACAIDGTWCYFDDPWEDVTWNWATNYPDRRPELDPTAPEYMPNMYGNYSGPGAIDWDQWSYQKAPALYILNEDGSIQYNGWGASPTNPSADAWNNIIVPEDGLYQKYPVMMPSLDPGMFGNYVGCSYLEEPLGPNTGLEFTYGSMIAGSVAPVGFPDLFKMIDDGAKVIEAQLIYKADGLKRVVGTMSQSYDYDPGVPEEERWTRTSSLTETTEQISWLLLGQKCIAGNQGYRSLDWDILGHSLPSTAGNNNWHAADVKDLMQAYIDNYRGKSIHHGFAFIPAPYAGDSFLGTADARGILKGLLPSVEWTYFFHPDYAPIPGYPAVWYPGCGDFEYVSSVTGSYVTWGSLQFKEIGIKFRLPDGTITRKCYPFNMTRTD